MESGEAYGGQYLYVVAVIDGPQSKVALPSRERYKFLEGFRSRFEEKVKYWRDLLAKDSAMTAKTYVWGAGSKGFTFVNIVDQCAALGGLIDRHPNKGG